MTEFTVRLQRYTIGKVEEEAESDEIQIDGRFGCLASFHFSFVFFY